MDIGLDGAALKNANGQVIANEDFNKGAKLFTQTTAITSRLQGRVDDDVMNAILSGLTLDLDTEVGVKKAVDELNAYLTQEGVQSVLLAPQELEGQWRIVLSRNVFGVERVSYLDTHFSHSTDYLKLSEAGQFFAQILQGGGIISRGEGERKREQIVRTFKEAMDWLMQDTERTITRQRYKGLGEMNADQLWETTIDPSNRRMLKVQIEDAIAADQIFTTLMGDDVEPRRAFIEANALKARNIDV
ncbi:unnamed protein product [Darwinula stevensoni]|uniref:DNA topoisomerase (ATP-hydrolyzing) n=1 Tax=Darwinula stevensoni TaxID=69355 RepID=A0A7R9AHL6_9CRUS|nr:unnamed protein product [Darwinula stevensoni]CAG0905561.1 unnamed protein product [Darwinula stevensoni]